MVQEIFSWVSKAWKTCVKKLLDARMKPILVSFVRIGFRLFTYYLIFLKFLSTSRKICLCSDWPAGMHENTQTYQVGVILN